jgi:hypothetical protein
MTEYVRVWERAFASLDDAASDLEASSGDQMSVEDALLCATQAQAQATMAVAFALLDIGQVLSHQLPEAHEGPAW